MAEERNVGLQSRTAPEITSDDDTTKAELQRRMEEARESITQTVSEIKDTVANQYQNVRETFSEALDWREQFRKRPVAFSVGALSVGLLAGYGLVSSLSDERGEQASSDYDRGIDDYAMVPVSRAYAGQAMMGSSAYGRGSAAAQPEAGNIPAPRPSYSSGYEQPEPQKPGILERFKETSAYDRLQAEVAALGDRFVDELSRTAQNVVLPAVLGKLKDMVGIDLSTQREVAQRSNLEQQASTAQAGAAHAGAAASAAGTPASPSGASPGTAQNAPGATR